MINATMHYNAIYSPDPVDPDPGETHTHSYNLMYDANYHWKKCECGDSIDKELHSFGIWSVTRRATATTKGEKQCTCTVCGYTKTEEIPATGGGGGITPPVVVPSGPEIVPVNPIIIPAVPETIPSGSEAAPDEPETVPTESEGTNVPAGSPDSDKTERPVTKTTTKKDGTVVKTTTEKKKDGTKITTTLKTSAEGKITSAKATVTIPFVDDIKEDSKKEDKGNGSIKTKVSAEIVKSVVSASGTKSVKVTTAVKDAEGNTAYKLGLNTSDLIPGKKLKVFIYDSKTKSYSMTDAGTVKVGKDGSISVELEPLTESNRSYKVVNTAEVKKLQKAILKTVKPAKKEITAKKGDSIKFSFSSKMNMSNIKNIAYSSENKKIATVSKTGKIKVKKSGSVVIKAVVTLLDGTTKTVETTIKAE